MKRYYFLILTLLGILAVTLLSSAAKAQSCSTDTNAVVSEVQEDVNTKVPKVLEGAKIIIRRADGKEEVLKAEDFKVVKRVQQFKVTERNVTQKVTCNKDTQKNLLMLGGRKDHTDYDISSNGNSLTVQSDKKIVLDAAYMRQKLVHIKQLPIGAGLGIDTNGTVKGLVGVEF